MIAYNCKYTPIELLSNFDDCTLLTNSAENFDFSDSLMHANMCSHVKAHLENIHTYGYENLFFINCCTCTAKLYDVLTMQLSSGWTHLMDLPTETGQCAIQKLTRDLVELIPVLEKQYGKAFDPAKFAASFEDLEFQYPPTPFLLLLGARSNPALLKVIHDCFEQPVIDMTCANNGRVVQPGIRADDPLEEMMAKYARALVSQIPCMRMSDITSRKQFLNNENCIGIIYHTIKFCDYYGFEYSALKKEEIPILKIETDYTTQSAGQILTRLEGFAESLRGRTSVRQNNKRKDTGNMNASNTSTAGPAVKVAADSDYSSGVYNADTAKKIYFAGIDSGSTSTELVVLDEQKNIVKAIMVRTGANAAAGAQKALAESGIPQSAIQKIVATGYGRKNIAFAHSSVTEITCHAKGAKHLLPEVRAIIDIGGQDSKVITLDENGSVVNFVMNDKCAAGTGRFLENMAKVLEVSLSDMATLGLHYKNDLTISSMCTVFAESEVVSLIAENHSREDIIHGLNKSVATKTKALAKGSLAAIAASQTAANNAFAAQKAGKTHGTAAGGKKQHVRIMMTGGVANNKGVVSELEKQLGTSIFICEQPEFCGALGAALIAMEE